MVAGDGPLFLPTWTLAMEALSTSKQSKRILSNLYVTTTTRRSISTLTFLGLEDAGCMVLTALIKLRADKIASWCSNNGPL